MTIKQLVSDMVQMSMAMHPGSAPANFEANAKQLLRMKKADVVSAHAEVKTKYDAFMAAEEAKEQAKYWPTRWPENVKKFFVAIGLEPITQYEELQYKVVGKGVANWWFPIETYKADPDLYGRVLAEIREAAEASGRTAKFVKPPQGQAYLQTKK